MNRKAYILTGYDMKDKFYIETQVFTNRKIAERTYAEFIAYLVYNHRLDRDKIEYSNPTREVFTATIEGKYFVSLRIFDIRNKVIKY